MIHSHTIGDDVQILGADFNFDGNLISTGCNDSRVRIFDEATKA